MSTPSGRRGGLFSRAGGASGAGEAQTPAPSQNYFNFQKAASKKINTAFRIYRFTSLLLCAFFFFLMPAPFSLYGKSALVLLLLVTALALVFFYERYQENLRVFTVILVVELIGVSILLAFSGGIQSPFLWYALNPLILSIVYLHYLVAWTFLGIFLLGALRSQIMQFAETQTWRDLFPESLPPLLLTITIVLIMQVFARMYLLLSEESSRAELQQKELFSTYQNLSQHYQMFQTLSHFQREVAAYQDVRDILKNLTKTALEVFPLEQCAALVPRENSHAEPHDPPFHILTPEQHSLTPAQKQSLAEIKERWPEFSWGGSSQVMLSRRRDWIAVPMRVNRHPVYAIFMAWLKPQSNPASFSDNLKLFINFAEQSAQRLHVFKQNEHQLQQLSSLYAAVEAISSRTTPQEITDLFAAYGRSMTGCEKVILWMETPEVEGVESQPIYSVKGRKETYPEEDWQDALLETWGKIKSKPEATIQRLTSAPTGMNQRPPFLICVPIKSGARCFGVVCGINTQKTNTNEEVMQTLNILGELSAIAVEKNLTELFADKLLVLDEQNRIANEIHDTISQNIFSVVYGLDALAKEGNKGIEKPLSRDYLERMTSIKNLASDTARELRLLIYRLSPRKRGDNTFLKEIKGYLEGMAKLNQIDIHCEFSGKEEYLNPAVRKAFYRIIKEAAGNSIRHGQCSEMWVELEMNPFSCVLKVKDNGQGFPLNSDQQEAWDLYTSGNRLGLVNMRELALSLQGNLQIHSEPGEGTQISCSVPTVPLSRGKAAQ